MTRLESASRAAAARGRRREAEPLFRLALSIREKALGTSDADVASSLNGLGVLVDNQARNEEAEAVYKRLWLKALGPTTIR